MNTNDVLKVYFTHDRKVYMHTAKCKDAIITSTEYKSRLFSLSITNVCVQAKKTQSVSIYTVLLLVLAGDNYSELHFCHLKSKVML